MKRCAKMDPDKFKVGMPNIDTHNFVSWGIDVRHHFPEGEMLDAEIFVCTQCGKERAIFQ